LTLAEVLREFAAYLRRVSAFYRKDADEGEVCLKVVEHQASFATICRRAQPDRVRATFRGDPADRRARRSAGGFRRIVSTWPITLRCASPIAQRLAAQMESCCGRSPTISTRSRSISSSAATTSACPTAIRRWTALGAGSRSWRPITPRRAGFASGAAHRARVALALSHLSACRLY